MVLNYLNNLPLNIVHCPYLLDGAPAHCRNGVGKELLIMFETRLIGCVVSLQILLPPNKTKRELKTE